MEEVYKFCWDYTFHVLRCPPQSVTVFPPLPNVATGSFLESTLPSITHMFGSSDAAGLESGDINDHFEAVYKIRSLEGLPPSLSSSRHGPSPGPAPKPEAEAASQPPERRRRRRRRGVQPLRRRSQQPP